CWTSRKRIDAPVFLHEGGVGCSTVTDRPRVVVQPDGPRKHRGRDRFAGAIKLDIVDAHPTAAAAVTVADALKADDVIGPWTNLRVHSGQSELRGGVSLGQLRRADHDLSLNQDSVEIDFDA